MKRIKIMMLSLALLAVVGGALAFKAKFSGYSVCYTTTTEGIPPAQQSCPELVGYTSIVPGSQFTTIYTTDKVQVNGVRQCEFKDANQTRLTDRKSVV